MNRRRLSAGNLLLLELIFAIFFFCLSVTVTVSVFGRAFSMSRDSAAMNQAVSCTKDIAEIIRASETVAEAEKYLKADGLSPNSDGDFEKLYGNDKYRLTVSASLDGDMYTALMKCTNAATGDEIYTLSITHWMKGVAHGG